MDLLLMKRRIMLNQERKEYILFVDPVAEQICATNWGDGIGIKPSQAASVTAIQSKFYNNSQLTSFDELQNFTGLTLISENAFYLDSNLTSINIPNTVVTLGQRAFKNCSSLTSIGDMSNITSIGYECFSGATSFTGALYLPALQTFAGNGAEFYNTGITSITSLGTITQLKNQSFAYCSSLVSIDLPATITSLPQWCFLNCTSLTTVTIHATTPPTCDRTFQGCSSLTAIYVPAEAVTDYQTASYWSGFSGIIQAIS